MSNPATRLISLIMLLQRKPNQTAADLADELGISVRTLHRYFGMLEEMGIPVYSERGPYGGFSLVKGYRMPPLVFSPEEAVAVYLGTSLVEEMWGQLYRESAHAALAKLDNVLPDEQRHEVAWARRTLLATGMHRSDVAALAPTLEKLRRAAREPGEVALVHECLDDTAFRGATLGDHGRAHRVDSVEAIHAGIGTLLEGHRASAHGLRRIGPSVETGPGTHGRVLRIRTARRCEP